MKNNATIPLPDTLAAPHIMYNVSGQEPERAAGLGESEMPWYLHPQWRAMGPIEPGLLTGIGVLISLVGLAGTAGNMLVLLLHLRCKKLQTSANMYVFNLAAADLMMCAGNFPLLILASFSGRWVAGYVGCKIYAFLGGLSGFVSINTLTAMACDRYNVIYRYKGLLKPGSKRHSLGLLVSLWIYSFFWAMPPFFGWGQFALDGGQISCCFDYMTRNVSNASYIIAIFIFCFGIQMVVILYCYISIVATVCHHEQGLKRANMDIMLYHNHFHQHSFHLHRPLATTADTAANTTTTHTPATAPTDEERDALAMTLNNEDVLQEHVRGGGQVRKRGSRRRRVEVQVTKLVCGITLSFCVSWMPFAVVSLMGIFGDASKVTPLVSVLPGILAKMATVINPVLYAIGHPHYRNVFLKQYRKARDHRSDAKLKEMGKKQKAGTPNPQTTRGMLSSVYFATVLRNTDDGSSAGVESASERRGALDDVTIV